MHPEIKNILYATDLGDHMRPVFRFAIEIAKKHASTITMLHVTEPLSSEIHIAINAYMPEIDTKEAVRDGMSKALERMQSRLGKFCEEELNQHPEECELIKAVRVVVGKPAETITEQARKLETDLIVVGTHTDPSIGAQLLGSTARKVTQLSRIPVLVVPVYE